MKKIYLLFFIFIGLFILAACGSGDNSQSNAPSDSQDTLNTTIIGGRTGGAWSVFAEGVAESIRREHDGSIITVEPGGIVENPPTVGTGVVPYGLSYAMTSYAAYTGEEPYTEPYEDLRAVSVIIPSNYYQFLVRANEPYDSIAEIVEQQVPIRLAVDQKGSAGEIMTRNIFQEYGVTYDDIISWGGSVDYLSGSKTFEMMADNRIDAAGDAVSAPSGDIIEAATSMNMKMLPLDSETMQAVAEELGMKSGTIQAGTYAFLEEDIPTISTPAILITHKDIPEEEVYQITQAIYDNFDYLRNVHQEFKNLTEETIMDVGNVPLHPGAEKFFREKGLME
ncbi:TAXI family TRAP transporter solute-binding subunit [Oceanobacillus saliphilus]|uniref:TAXI family TRAP transporter solute-binding subunit n=1 Tax=Oceanobacillus saliphilus TaxID=2925834 RepID=UPI00201D7E58|nr:TAXI family TRAP transporter solute-binding subunit [Oceanobacillus saliphilus]